MDHINKYLLTVISSMSVIEIVPYSPVYASAFKSLNEAWITKYFKLEPEDIRTLNHPQKIIDQGGYIFVALNNEEIPVGVCALKKVDDTQFEFSKMAVDEKWQGFGVGKKLIDAALAQARTTDAKSLYLEGNTLLEASIHLYKKVGFEAIEGGQTHYERVNITMQLVL
jgi:N-acetylglutamate synthase-like GNAT family acetyltransferase